MHEAIINNLKVLSDGETVHLSHLRSRSVKELTLDAGGVRELMEFLRQCAEGELDKRNAFRVPVYANSGLSAALMVNGKPAPMVPRNISYTGIYVEALPEQDPGLKKGAIIDVQMVFDERSLTQRGVIRRRSVNGYGIFFPESLKHENVEPNPVLKDTVDAIKRQISGRRR